MSKQHAYEVIYETLLADILSGKLPAGSLLPSENDIALQYGVSRITSRRALTMLADKGYISRRPGIGSKVLPLEKPVQTIGLAMANFDAMFGMEFVKGVLHEAKQQGYLVICRIGYLTISQEEQATKDLLEAGVKGIVIIPLYEAKHCGDAFVEITQKVPMVFGDREIVGLNIPLVCTDNTSATQHLCNHLYDQGHRCIAFISSSTNSTAVGQRYKGYHAFCANMGVHPTAFTGVRSILPGMNRHEVRSRDVAEIVRFLQDNRHITALVAHTYQVAKLVCEAIHYLGCSVPRDYSVVCFDAPQRVDEAEWFGHIQQNEFLLGVRSVQCLIQRIEGNPVPSITLVEGQYVEGQSCNQPPNWFHNSNHK